MVSMRSRRPSVDTSIPAAGAAAAIGGAKTIGLVGGVALLINNITGSAMVLFPSLYQQAGWFLVTLALFFVAFLSYVCAIMIIEAMAAMPGNHKFTRRVEYTTLSYYYLGKYGYAITQFFFQFSLAFNNMSSIIQSVQVMDFAIAAIFGKSCAVPEFYPKFQFTCPTSVENDITPFGDIYLLSIGFIITALVCAPLGFWNLDDNIIIQKISCSAVISMVLVWIGLFIGYWGLEADRVVAVGSTFNQVLGVTVFNFAIITSIPSWVNEKKENVSILATMGIAMPMALGLFSVIGIFGGMAFVPWFNGPDSDQTLLNKLQDSSSAIAHVTFYLFPVVVNLTSIPVFAIMQRYNLLEAKVCNKPMANFLGVVLPWLICIPFYTGNGFSDIVNWGGIIFNSTVNFIIPPLIYISMVRKQRARGIITAERLHLGALSQQGAAYESDEDTIKHTKIVINPPEASKRPVSLLGPRDSKSDSNASLKQSLLSGGSSSMNNYDGSHLYVPSEIDIRTEEEERREHEILGYDTFEAAREEEDELEKVIAARKTSHAAAPSAGSSHLASINDLQHVTNERGETVPAVDASLALPASDSDVDTFLQGWQAMPKPLLPYRIHIAAIVAVSLVILALIVIGINIQSCVNGSC